jgi:hypothetical protein
MILLLFLMDEQNLILLDIQDPAIGNGFQGDEWQRQMDSKRVKEIQVCNSTKLFDL